VPGFRSYASTSTGSTRLPNATIRSFPGAGHLLFEERPDAASALVDFFRA
jgi:pimeloyl-ACP methyl ester carboxylesterase